jgi:FtsH-binding integral membrane protein
MLPSAKLVVRDTLILLGLTFLGGFIVGMVYSGEDNGAQIGLSNLVFSVLGFYIVGILKETARLKHLVIVALLYWLIGSHNMLLGISISQWLISLVVILICMGVGGCLSFLVSKEKPVTDV